MSAPVAADNPPSPTANERPLRRLDSAKLMAGHKRVVIEHDGTEYQLQLTRQGKLILTK